MPKRLSYILIGLLIVAGYSQTNAAAPTIHSYFLKITGQSCSELELGWIIGDGDRRIVTIRESGTTMTLPVNNTHYNANEDIHKADELGTGVYVIYDGTGMNAKARGLKKHTSYTIHIFEYNRDGGKIEYLTTNGYGTISFTSDDIIADFAIDNSYQCLAGNEIRLLNKSFSSTGAVLRYSYDFGDGISSTQPNPKHSYESGGIFTVKLTITSNGCSDSTEKSDTVVVPYVTRFELEDNQLGFDSLRCISGLTSHANNQSYRPSVPVYGAFDITKHSWYRSGTLVANNFHHTYQFDKPGEYELQLVTGRRVKKGSQTPYCYDTFTVQTQVFDSLGADIIHMKDSLFCKGTSSLIAHLKKDQTLSHKWYFASDSFTRDSLFHSFVKTGSDSLKIAYQHTSGCRSELVKPIYVYEQPRFDLGRDTLIAKNASLTLNVSNQYPEYTWSTGDKTHQVIIEGENLPEGENKVWLRVDIGSQCSYSDTITIKVTPLGVRKINTESVQIFPNPVTSYLNVLTHEPTSYTLLNPNGHTLKEGSFQKGDNLLELGALPAGLYLLQIQSHKGMKTLKLIKNN